MENNQATATSTEAAVTGIQVPDIPGLMYVPDFLSREDEVGALQAIAREPWKRDLARAVQHHGWRYDYRQRTVTPDMRIGPLPEWAAKLAEQVAEVQGPNGGPSFATTPDQVIVNRYLPGQGIGWHTDAASFGPVLATLSLGDTWTMMLRDTRTTDLRAIRLERGSLLVLSSKARSSWQHSIVARDLMEPNSDGSLRRRRQRTSVTFRTVIR